MSSSLVFVATALLLFLNGVRAAEPLDWWEMASYYQVYPWSFMDSDGNGVGDLKGITSRLKYIRDLGMDAVWLSPVFESPMVDMGYDVANFTNIDPIFGTLKDMDDMIKEAHKLGLKVILDFVPNHSSDKCEWFQKSIRREPGYEDFYVWQDPKIDQATGERMPPTNWISRFNGTQWEWNEQRQQYYLHQFFKEQPDFNLTNPFVRQTLVDVLRFWLDRGVDSFRVDAIPFYIERQTADGKFEDQDPVTRNFTYSNPRNSELLYEWREFLDSYQKEHGGDTRMMLSESLAPNEDQGLYVGNGTHLGAQMPMYLKLVKVNDEIDADIFYDRIDGWMNVMWKGHKVANWAFANHDNSRVGSRCGYNRAQLVMILQHSLPGATVTYYGEEIGMTDGELDCDTRTCGNRDGQRTPMQWDTTKNSGFSTGNSTWLPVHGNHKFINVESERKTNRSSLKIFKEMIKLKKSSAFRAFKEPGAFEYGALSQQIFHIMRTDNVTEYRIFANFGNQIEHIDGITNKVMEYVVLNTYSPHKKGDQVDLSKQIYLMPFEAVVLRSVA